MKIILYTTGCPKCGVLVTKLDNKNIEYEVCTDTAVMASLGISQVPVLSVDGELMPFKSANDWINNL